MNQVSYRYREVVKPADCEHVRRIVASSGFFSEDEVEVAVELVEERLHKGPASGYFFLFVEAGGEGTVGYACFGPIACTRTSYDLYWIALLDASRGRGIGWELLKRSEELIAAQGGTRIYVETSSRDQYEPTRRFYRRCGYREEAVLKDFYAPGDDKVIFLKVL